VPLPDQAVLDRFYDSGAYWQGTGDNLLQQAHERAQSELRVRYCLARRTAQTPISVLDVGAGHGWTADWLARYLPGNVARFDFVEPDERNAARILRKSVPFPVARIPSLAAAAGRYDLVFLNHVLEHMADPIAATVQVASRLTATGFAYVETPHSDYRFKDDVFPHVFFFTPKALAVLGERLGVRTAACETFGRMPAPRLSPTGLMQRVAARALRMAKSAPLQRVLDRIVWRYAPCDDGIWLRWIFSGMKAR